MQTRVDPRSVSVRDLSEADVPFVLDYWFRSPPGFIEPRGSKASSTRTSRARSSAAAASRSVQIHWRVTSSWSAST